MFDAYTKARDDGIQVKTLCGAMVTVVSVIIMCGLVLSEVGLFLTTRTEHHLGVDRTRSEALHVDVDVIFHAMPCNELDVVIGDTRGHSYPEAKIEVTKAPFVPPITMREQPDVKWTKDNTPGCSVTGSLSIRKMAGMIVFRSTRPRIHGMNGVPAQVGAANGRNFSHEIRQLSMGPSFPGAVNPLDGVKKGFDDSGVFQYQYFLKIVPTVYEYASGAVTDSNQFSVTEFASKVDQNSMYDGVVEEVTFKVDFSPIMVRLHERRRGVLKFLTGLCAILGGVFTVAGMVDSTVYQSSKAIMGKTL